MVIRLLGMWFASSLVATPFIALLVKRNVAPLQPAYVHARRG